MPKATAAAVAADAGAQSARGKPPTAPTIGGDDQRPASSGTMLGTDEALPTTRSARTPRGFVGSSGVTWKQLMLFVFPANLEHPESTGRLELFARVGPVDEQGRLRGGIAGVHIHTSLEIRIMIKNETREALFAVYNKPRTTVEVLVDMLVPLAIKHNYTLNEVKKLLKNVATDTSGQMSFAAIQEVILENQRERLKTLIREGDIEVEARPKVAHQSKASCFHLAFTDRKKFNEQEEAINISKRQNNYSCAVAGLEDMNKAAALSANVLLIRPRGDASDKWDRYCAVRRVGKASYVSARNTPRQGNASDDGLADKHAGTASLISSTMHRHVTGNR